MFLLRRIIYGGAYVQGKGTPSYVGARELGGIRNNQGWKKEGGDIQFSEEDQDAAELSLNSVVGFTSLGTIKLKEKN